MREAAVIRDKGLLLIDPQAAFIERSDATRAVGDRICHLLDQQVFSSTVATRFKNLPGSPHQTILNWSKMTTLEECELWGPIAKRVPEAEVVDKGTYSSATDEVLCNLQSGDTLFLAGFDTDCCVLVTAVDLFQRGIRPVVLADYCGSSGNDRSHEAGLVCLARQIGAHNIILDAPTPQALRARLLQAGLIDNALGPL